MSWNKKTWFREAQILTGKSVIKYIIHLSGTNRSFSHDVTENPNYLSLYLQCGYNSTRKQGCIAKGRVTAEKDRLFNM